jgi:hypothetical protein
LRWKSDLHVNFDFLELWKNLSLNEAPNSEQVSPTSPGLPIETLDWTKWIEINTKKFIGGGGFGDAYMGEWCNVPETLLGVLPEVVVKAMRVRPQDAKNIAKSYKVVNTFVVLFFKVMPELIIAYTKRNHYLEWPSARTHPSVCWHLLSQGVRLSGFNISVDEKWYAILTLFRMNCNLKKNIQEMLYASFMTILKSREVLCFSELLGVSIFCIVSLYIATHGIF